MTIAIIILSLFFIVLLVYVAILALVKRNKERKLIVLTAYKKDKKLDLAVAGSNDGCHKSVSQMHVYGLEYTIYKDSNGKNLNPDEYELYVVDGESMQFCGIHNNDLLFSTKGWNIAKDSKFPMVLIIKKTHIDESSPAFKVRRAWCIANYDDNLLNVVGELLQSDKFQQIRRLNEYDGDDAVIRDFQESRLQRYENEFIHCENPNVQDKTVVISTTYHTDNNLIRLSIHPITKVMGRVIASFPLSDKQLSI